MLVLTCSSKLAALRCLLTHSFPESLKACGALHHVINGNPFKLEVLVDRWPEFSTVMCRPSLEDMKDPSDHYTNTYFLFSRDPQNLRQILEDPKAVNWNQDLQIQGCQPALGGVLQEVSSKHGKQMQTTSNFLYMKDRIAEEELEKINNISSKELCYTSLSVHEAPLVNSKWALGMNQQSLRFVEHCIQYLPTICVRKKGLDHPIAWGLTENCEIRMGYTTPAYRNLGLAQSVLLKLAAANYKTGAPVFVHVAPDNILSQASVTKAGFELSGRWQQYYFKQPQ
ncbi:glycine N-acyltransferase-like isoform X1 [Pyxicephalus adspersus]|uniref:glycine N-acyltransferase-like isoform X1 n=1 Tax=Pyxicephalus adspersus TaxID=30357 RepID=UPI003B5AD427